MGSRTAPTVFDSGWSAITASGRASIVTATKKTIATRLVLHCADGVAFGNNRVNGVYGRVLLRTRAATRNKRTLFAYELRLDEKIAERRMRDIGRRRRQNDFSVARQLDFAGRAMSGS